MRYCITIIALLLTLVANGQDTAKAPVAEISHDAFERHSAIATLSAGFMDSYRSGYSLPAAFQKTNTTGFAPAYFKLEYGLSKHIGIAASFMYDDFYYNYSQTINEYGTLHKRYYTDNVTAFSGGLILYYHFNRLIPVRNLDVFIGAGGAIDAIHYTSQAQADGTMKDHTEHTASPIARLGARYYLGSRGSIFADVGYDKASIFSIGFSFRFFGKK